MDETQLARSVEKAVEQSERTEEHLKHLTKLVTGNGAPENGLLVRMVKVEHHVEKIGDIETHMRTMVHSMANIAAANESIRERLDRDEEKKQVVANRFWHVVTPVVSAVLIAVVFMAIGMKVMQNLTAK